MSEQTPTAALDDAGTIALVALLEQQRDLYRQLAELSGRQRDLITGDQPEQLLSLLYDRDKLVKALARINQQMAPYRKNWDAIFAALPGDVRQRVTTVLAEINALLARIVQTDKEDGEVLEARKQAVGANIQTLHDGRAAHNAYARQARVAVAPKRDQHG